MYCVERGCRFAPSARPDPDAGDPSVIPFFSPPHADKSIETPLVEGSHSGELESSESDPNRSSPAVQPTIRPGRLHMNASDCHGVVHAKYGADRAGIPSLLPARLPQRFCLASDDTIRHFFSTIPLLVVASRPRPLCDPHAIAPCPFALPNAATEIPDTPLLLIRSPFPAAVGQPATFRGIPSRAPCGLTGWTGHGDCLPSHSALATERTLAGFSGYPRLACRNRRGDCGPPEFVCRFSSRKCRESSGAHREASGTPRTGPPGGPNSGQMMRRMTRTRMQRRKRCSRLRVPGGAMAMGSTHGGLRRFDIIRWRGVPSFGRSRRHRGP
jgi:hypothetical protein